MTLVTTDNVIITDTAAIFIARATATTTTTTFTHSLHRAQALHWHYICNNNANHANSRIVSERKSSSKKGAVVQFRLYHLAPKT